MRTEDGLDEHADEHADKPGETRRDPHADDVVPSVSDATTRRLLIGVLITIAAAVVLGLFAAAALWALSGDDEPDIPMNAVDVGFLQDMIDHHGQALVISNAYLDGNPDGDAAPYAHEVVMFQTRDLGWMRDWLAEEGYAEGEADRATMEWMGDPTPIAEMPGMQTPEQIQELAAATGPEADRLFFQMMSEHHLGGVHMADFAAASTELEWLTTFAEAVSYGQQIEVVEYDQARERFGLPPRQ